MTRRLLFLSWTVFAHLACGTGAVGVDDCRNIELARCEEANACGIVEDVEECRRYYRSHCLHGLAVSSRPPRDERERCITAIREAGACARQQGAETPLEDCEGGAPAEGVPERTLQTACDVVARPWDATACDFLNPRASDEGSDPSPGGASGE